MSFLLCFFFFYLTVSTLAALYIYNKYYYYFYPIKNEEGKDLHQEYPEFSRTDAKFFTKKRLIFGMPFAIIKAFLLVGISAFLFLVLK